MDILKGKKTYLIAAAWAIITFLYSMGWIDAHTYQLIQGFLFPAGIAALRAGLK